LFFFCFVLLYCALFAEDACWLRGAALVSSQWPTSRDTDPRRDDTPLSTSDGPFSFVSVECLIILPCSFVLAVHGLVRHASCIPQAMDLLSPAPSPLPCPCPSSIPCPRCFCCFCLLWTDSRRLSAGAAAAVVVVHLICSCCLRSRVQAWLSLHWFFVRYQPCILCGRARISPTRQSCILSRTHCSLLSFSCVCPFVCLWCSLFASIRTLRGDRSAQAGSRQV
jgi:hypothetical protein